MYEETSVVNLLMVTAYMQYYLSCDQVMYNDEWTFWVALIDRDQS